MALDLPINDVKGYVEELIEELGEDVIIDNFPTKAMFSDLEKTYNHLQENMRQVAVKKDVPIDVGSKIELADGQVLIVYSRPKNDLVSLSCKALICNSIISIKEYVTVYKDDGSGDISSRDLIEKQKINGFVEKIRGAVKIYDVGAVHKDVLKFTTFPTDQIKLSEPFYINDKRYRCVDIDDSVIGLFTLTLESDK